MLLSDIAKLDVSSTNEEAKPATTLIICFKTYLNKKNKLNTTGMILYFNAGYFSTAGNLVLIASKGLLNLLIMAL